MALQKAGINISVDSFIDNYLDKGATPIVGGTGPDPDLVYCGNPRLKSGWGCYSPVIVNALNKFVNKNTHTVSQFYGKSLDELCHTYIDNNIPVIMWATVGTVSYTHLKKAVDVKYDEIRARFDSTNRFWRISFHEKNSSASVKAVSYTHLRKRGDHPPSLNTT